MKRKIAFSLAEIIIAVTFVGILAALTLPKTIDGVKSKHNIEAYMAAYKRAEKLAMQVFEEEPPEGVEPQNFEPIGLRLWKKLSGSLPVIGYSDQEGVSYNKIVNENSLKPAAQWDAGEFVNFDNKIGIKNSAEVAKTSITSSGVTHISPWIVTQNMAFAIYIYSGVWYRDNANCEKADTISLQKTYEDAYSAACGMIIVDVNGLDQGPNQPRLSYSSKESPDVVKGMLDNEIVKYDRFYIFIGKDGYITPGPSKSLESRIKARSQEVLL